MPVDKKPAVVVVAAGKNVCPSCRAQNEPGTLMCKRCGEILSSKGKKVPVQEFDGTEGGFHPGCWIAVAVVMLGALLFFFLAVRGGAKPGTCEYNQGHIGMAVYKYNKAHPESKMTTLDLDELMKPGKSGKPLIKDRPVCPVDSSAKYELGPDGTTVLCTTCSKKHR
ncbi:MAG TPA: hypothetical protein PKM25_11375 [Candidatus Ozemobacteraceae bacterium]|nr:hypothetical protein [Candidatus Ozemobacteraceae bacterium]